MKKLIPFLIFLLLIPCAAAAGTTVSLSDPVVQGGQIIVDVNIADVTKLGVAAFTIEYEENDLTLKGSSSGAFSPKSTVAANSENGMVLVMTPGLDGVSGTGVLAKLIFSPATPPRKTTISLTDIGIGDNRGVELESNTKSNAVTYDPSTAQVLSSPPPRMSDLDVKSPAPSIGLTPTLPTVSTPAGPAAAGEAPAGEEAAAPSAPFKSIYIIVPIILVILVGGVFVGVNWYKKTSGGAQKKTTRPAAIPTTKPTARPAARPALAVKPVAKPVKPAAKPIPAKPKPDPALAYIKSCKSKGLTDEQIKAELKKQGWSETDIANKMSSASS